MHYGHSKNNTLATKICETINTIEFLSGEITARKIVGEAIKHTFPKTDKFRPGCVALTQTFLDAASSLRTGRVKGKRILNEHMKVVKKVRTTSPIKHKEESKMVTEDHSHNDLYKYKYNLYFSHKKSHRRLGTWEYFTQKNGYVECNEGKQGNGEIWCVGHALQVFAPETPAATIPVADEQNPYKWTVAPYALNPYKVINAGTLFSGAGIPNPVIDKIHLEYIETSTIINNVTICPVQVELCWMTPRKSQGDGPLQSWRNVLTDKALGLNNNDNPDYNNAAPVFSSVARGTDDMYGLSPHSHKEWRRQWKTLHRKSFYLNGGDQRKVMHKIHYNKTWDRAYGATVHLYGFCSSATGIVAAGVSLQQDMGSRSIETGYATGSA